VTTKSGILDGKDEISRFLGNASDYKLSKWISAGMPVRIEDGRWLAHKDNLEEFFRRYTRINSKNMALDDFSTTPKNIVKKNNSQITPK
jgi:hypothetical protein